MTADQVRELGEEGMEFIATLLASAPVRRTEGKGVWSFGEDYLRDLQTRWVALCDDWLARESVIPDVCMERDMERSERRRLQEQLLRAQAVIEAARDVHYQLKDTGLPGGIKAKVLDALRHALAAYDAGGEGT